jgi:hypothetical protein
LSTASRRDKGGAIVANRLLSDDLSEPLNGAKTAKVDINSGIGNLTIDRLSGNEQALATGTLQYFEKQGRPKRSIRADDGAAVLTLRGEHAGRPWFQLPWTACTGGTEWQIHLSPSVLSDITAHTDGVIVNLNLAGMTVSHVEADSGGGNMELVLPDEAAELTVTARTGGGNVKVELGQDITGNSSVTASSGAGNVTVRVPSGLAARVHARSGFGRVTVNAPFEKVDSERYETPDYAGAANRVEITVSSGAGNVSVSTK